MSTECLKALQEKETLSNKRLKKGAKAAKEDIKKTAKKRGNKAKKGRKDLQNCY